MRFRWIPNGFSTKFEAGSTRFRSSDFRSFRWVFQRFSTKCDRGFPCFGQCVFVDFPLVFQRNPARAAHFPELSTFVHFTNAFSTKWHASGVPSRICNFVDFPLVFQRNFVSFGLSGAFSGFYAFVYNPNAFRRKFVSFDAKLVPKKIGFLERTIRSHGCAHFVDLLTVFQRNGTKSQPVSAASPNLQFRWFSIGFSTKSTSSLSLLGWCNFVDFPLVFQRNPLLSIYLSDFRISLIY